MGDVFKTNQLVTLTQEQNRGFQPVFGLWLWFLVLVPGSGPWCSWEVGSLTSSFVIFAARHIFDEAAHVKSRVLLSVRFALVSTHSFFDDLPCRDSQRRNVCIT